MVAAHFVGDHRDDGIVGALVGIICIGAPVFCLNNSVASWNAADELE